MADPLTITAAIVAALGIGKLLKPLLDVAKSYLHFKKHTNIQISVTDKDGTVKSIKVAKSEATEEQLKKIIALLGDADDGSK